MSELSRQDVHPDPFTQFREWFEAGKRAQPILPEAAALATASRAGEPSIRTVLLKSFDENGFVFFTNYESQKGLEIEENPHAALLFHWRELERQISLAGTVSRIPREASEAYFKSRPRGSQIAALVSPQSRVVESRKVLEESYREAAEKYREKKIPLPPEWGGYRLLPGTIEFWQGRANRLHDRILYSRAPDGSWTIERLAP